MSSSSISATTIAAAVLYVKRLKSYILLHNTSAIESLYYTAQQEVTGPVFF
jgi:hypothetical protein